MSDSIAPQNNTILNRKIGENKPLDTIKAQKKTINIDKGTVTPS